MPLVPPPSFSPDHIHPILVNFTAALLPASVGSDLFGRLLRRPSLHTAAWWMLLYATAITPLTALAGWYWKRSVGSGLPPSILAVHQWLGTGLAILFVVLTVWRWKSYERQTPPGLLYLLCGAVAVLALAYQGSLGGAMVFGS